jgi:hypothetical protein
MMLVLQGILPLVVFALVDIFAGLRAALIAAIVFAVLEACWSYYTFGEIDHLTWVSLGLICVMGALSYKMKSDRLFKFQPVALGVIAALVFVYFRVTEAPLLLQLVPKVSLLLPPERRDLFESPQALAALNRLDLLMIAVLLIHSALVAWAAVRKSTMVWLIVRGVMLYVLMLLAVLLNHAIPL